MNKNNVNLRRRKLRRKNRRRKRIIINIKLLFILFILFLAFKGIRLIGKNLFSERDTDNNHRIIKVNNSIPNLYTIDENKNYDIDDGYEYSAKSMLAIDLSDDKIIFAKRPNDIILPASIAKLFVIDFSTNYLNLDDIVIPSYEAINSVKEGSSMAYIAIQEYSVENLYAAMLVPSGNDAAFVIAEETGRKIDSNAQSFDERINAFFTEFNKYLKRNNYTSTTLYDPSGFDYDATTSVSDIRRVCEELLKNNWFRDIICEQSYSAILPYGGIQTWENTNSFLDPNNDFYSSNVKGIKTGTVDNNYNLVILYEINGKEYLIISLDSSSDYNRYSDVNHLLNLIDDKD